MEDFLRFTLTGIPLGCIYALVAVGLVLTYKTSGVFNLAFGAQAFASAAIFYELRLERDWATLPAFLVAVVVVGPLVGVVLDRALFRYLRGAPALAKLVASLGLLVAIPALVELWVGSGTKFNPPSAAPDPDRVYRFGDYFLNADEVMAIAVTLAVVGLLGLLLRLTPLGLQMRGVVESPRLVELAGVNADRVGMAAWMLSSFMAGLAGVLLAPLFGTLDDTNFTVLLVAAIAAAAFGRLSSLSLTLAGGIVLGVFQQVLAGYLPLDSVIAQGLRPSSPFVMLLLLLLFWPGLRKRREAADPLAGVDPPPPALAATYRSELLDRVTRVAQPLVLTGFLFVALVVISDFWLFTVTQGVALATIFLSITIVTGMGGMISLAQATFAGTGAFTAAQLATRFDVPVLGAMLIGAVVAGLVGAVVAVPALRLGGIYLALATLAFALMVENIFFPLDWFGGGTLGVRIPRPVVGPFDFSSDRSFFVLALVVFALMAAVTILVRKGTTGRYLTALRGSEIAAATVGVNPTTAKITAFSLSAAVAGLGGALYGSLLGRVSFENFNFFLGLFWVVIVVTLGVRTVEGAANAGMALVLFPELLDLFGLPAAWAFVFFGLGALTFVRHPEGIVEANKRATIEWINRRTGRASPSGSRTP